MIIKYLLYASVHSALDTHTHTHIHTHTEHLNLPFKGKNPVRKAMRDVNKPRLEVGWDPRA